MGNSMIQKGSDTIDVFDTSFKLTYPTFKPYSVPDYYKHRNDTITMTELSHLRNREMVVHTLCTYLHMYSNDQSFAIGVVNYENYFDELRRRLNEIQYFNWALTSRSDVRSCRYKEEERDILAITIDGHFFNANIYTGGGADSSAVIYVFKKITTHTKDVALRAFLVNYLHDILGEELTEEGGMEL